MRAYLVLGLVLASTACTGQGASGSSDDIVKDVSAMPNVTKTVTLTEDNDPNDLIGRPNGYEAATVFYDERVKCQDGLGVTCGATLEVWPDDQAAQARADYIAGIQKEASFLGTEYHYVDGNELLRVSGDLKPSEAEAYEEAFAK